MDDQPSLQTRRLLLRPWRSSDTVALQRLADVRDIADTMISVPHPFSLEYAADWIGRHGEAWAEGRAAHFAITVLRSGVLAGAIELRGIEPEHQWAELSLWIGMEWWGQDLATEAGRAVLGYGFAELGLNRIQGFHMVRNPASGRVMEKLGMKREGVLRQSVRKWGQFEDVVIMAALRGEWSRPDLDSERY